jgi:hypothetical protein
MAREYATTLLAADESRTAQEERLLVDAIENAFTRLANSPKVLMSSLTQQPRLLYWTNWLPRRMESLATRHDHGEDGADNVQIFQELKHLEYFPSNWCSQWNVRTLCCSPIEFCGIIRQRKSSWCIRLKEYKEILDEAN